MQSTMKFNCSQNSRAFNQLQDLCDSFLDKQM